MQTDELERLLCEAGVDDVLELTPLERWWQTLGCDIVDGMPDERSRYALYDHHGEPIRCHLCGSHDRCVSNGAEPGKPWEAYLCKHGSISVSRGAIPVVSSVNAAKVAIAEVVQ